MRQLPLGIVLPESKSFDTLIAGPNGEALANLRRHIEQRAFGPFFLYGGTGSGKSHVLQAACHLATDCRLSPVYLSLTTTETLQPDALAGLEHLDLIAIDDLDHIAGQSIWELALFNLLNAAREQSTITVIAAANAPEALALQLPDLRSRLNAGLIYRLQPLDDDAKLNALQRHAQSRGMELSAAAGNYLMVHYPRDMGSLFDLLNRLDEASLVEQRRLTVPFIRQVLKDL